MTTATKPHAPWVERASWPDVETAIADFQAGRPIQHNQAVARYLAIPRAMTCALALDVCCGAGQGSLILRAKGYQVRAFDECGGCGALLAGHGVAFTCCAFEDYEPGLRFDLVACCDALEHLEHPARVLGSIREWLMPGGRLWLAVPMEGDGPSRNPFHVNSWSRRSLMQLLTDTGWLVDREYAPLNHDAFWGLLR